MTEPARCLVHATAIAADGRAALIMGPSGSGKSDLALRTITAPFLDDGRPVALALVADDQVQVERAGDRLIAAPPPTIAGKLEVRGLGIMTVAHLARADLVLAVSLAPAATIERLPAVGALHDVLGIGLPIFEIDGRQASAAARLVLAILRLGRP